MSLEVQAAVHTGKHVYSCSLGIRVKTLTLPRALLSGSELISLKAWHWLNMQQSDMTLNHF